MAFSVVVIQWGTANPANSENPKMKMFLELDKSQYFKFAIPTPATRPNMIQKSPPMTGSGIVTKKAENFGKSPIIIRTKAAVCIIRREAACVILRVPIFSE